MSGPTPVFAVIGRVNKGKSSIVSTLAEDDSVAIENVPGTTRACREYPVRIDGTTLLTLVDTPGFQQAPRALEWLRRHEVSAATRQDVVRSFIATFSGTDEFPDECSLLKPILDGAGILYVVDGAKPFRRNYEAEMEILRWTGQPRMALINQIGRGDFTGEWRPALDQYFSIVRTFNAHNVGFTERRRLLEAFRELHEPWRDALEQAISHLTREWERRKRVSAHTIAAMMTDMLTYVREIALEKHERADDYRLRLEKEFHDALRNREMRARRAIERLYNHEALETEEQTLDRPVFDQDLFAESTWNLLGLSLKQLVGLGAATGAAVGGAVDLGLGGSSFLMGTLVGGALGAGSAMFYSAQRLASIENIRKYVQGAQVVRIGPHTNRNFPWVLLDRAILHYFSIRDLAHSRRERVRLEMTDGKAGFVSTLPPAERKKLEKIFHSLRKRPAGGTARLQESLERHLLRLIAENDTAADARSAPSQPPALHDVRQPG